MDYKTGNKKFDEKQFEKGTALQLVFYLNLLAHDARYPQFKVFGFYYQPLNIGALPRHKESQEILIEKSIRLSGITLNNVPLYESYAGDLNPIESVSLTTKREFKRSKNLKDEQAIDSFMTRIEHHITTAVEAIRHGQFDINPQPNNAKTHISESCEYCPFNHICYLAHSQHPRVNDMDDSQDTAEEDSDNG